MLTKQEKTVLFLYEFYNQAWDSGYIGSDTLYGISEDARAISGFDVDIDVVLELLKKKNGEILFG